jgi:nucleoid-associated protein EbfC
MAGFSDIMKQAQEMQAKMADAQAQLEALDIEGSAGAGLVRVVLSGKGTLKSVSIAPEIFSTEGLEMIEDLIVAAHNDAKTKSETVLAEEMKKITGGLTLPPGMKMPF